MFLTRATNNSSVSLLLSLLVGESFPCGDSRRVSILMKGRRSRPEAPINGSPGLSISTSFYISGGTTLMVAVL